MTGADEAALLEAVRIEPRSVPEVVAALERLDALLADSDGLKWFTWLYLRVTRATAERIEAVGAFANPPWIARLDVEFARLYFRAVEAWLAGQPCPHCWRVLFERRHAGDIARVQFALAGVNAHINHDLAMAIIATFVASGGSPVAGGTQYADYTSLNATLEGLIGEARRELHVRLAGGALPEVSHLEDTLAAWSLTAAREAAWTSAELLWDVRDIPLLEGRYLDVLDGLAAVAGQTMLVPVPRA